MRTRRSTAILAVIPVVNKIDLPVTRIDEVLEEIETVVGLDATEAILVSAKQGIGIEAVFKAIIEKVPAPTGSPTAPLRALVFDSKYDTYRGVVTYVRVMEGTLQTGKKMRFMRTGTVHEILELGQFRPNMVACESLGPGQVGYIITGEKELGTVHVGDTVSDPQNPPAEPLPGYQQPQQMVFCGMYPIDATDFENLREELQKLSLNDASFSFLPETSDALGFGFRCGFLGLLHMEIIQQRLEIEQDIDLIQTAPNVTYQILTNTGELLTIDNPQMVPDAGQIEEFREPIAKINFILPADCIGAIMKLCEERRGIYKSTEYLGPKRTQLVYELPLAEIIFDMYDKLKSVTRGYGTMDYEVIGFRPADLIKLDVLVKGNRVDALSTIVHRSNADKRGRALVRAAQGGNLEAPVRDPAAGGHRLAGHRPRDDLRPAEERHGQVLWRGRHAEAEAAAKTAGRQKADEAVRGGRDPPEGVSLGPRSRRRRLVARHTLRFGCHAHGFAWACLGTQLDSHAHAKPWAWHPTRISEIDKALGRFLIQMEAVPWRKPSVNTRLSSRHRSARSTDRPTARKLWSLAV